MSRHIYYNILYMYFFKHKCTIGKANLDEDSDDEILETIKLYFCQTQICNDVTLFTVQAAELITVKARSNVTENQVEALKRDGEGKTSK